MRWETDPGDIVQFAGEQRWLSNFWPAQVEFEGMTYPTVEHAYQAAKTLNEAAREAIRACPTPGQAKRLGGTLELRPDWLTEKLVIMDALLRQKFAPGTELAARLQATGSAKIIEGNMWGDKFWGVDARTSLGENNLGRILMGIRDTLNDC